MDTAADQCTCGGDAWIVTDTTGENVRCNGYIKNNDNPNGFVLPIVSAATCVRMKNEDPFILIVHQACYHGDKAQTESLCLPYQAEQHGVTFSLTPNIREDSMGNLGRQNIQIEDKNIPLEFDGRKMYIPIQRPTDEELHSLDCYELTSPDQFNPEEANSVRRRSQTKITPDIPGNLSLERWRRCLALAPEDVVRKTFQATTQLAMNVEAENRMIGRRHLKSRFTFLKEKRVNDSFHSDTFFPTVKSVDGDVCSQLFLGRKSDYMYVHPMKKESHSFRALQDFGRKVGLPKEIKTDNASTEVGTKWTNWCRDHCIDTKYTEPHSPWQNIAEQGIGNLGTMVRRCMRVFKVPLSRHAWCQKWCADVRNVLASRKLDWRTPTEILTGDTPDISVFRFHFWEHIEYFDPTMKQPHDGWLPGRFLGIAWNSGDSMTFYVEPIKSGPGRRTVLTRSTVRPIPTPLTPVPTSSVVSGENSDQAHDELTEPLFIRKETTPSTVAETPDTDANTIAPELPNYETLVEDDDANDDDADSLEPILNDEDNALLHEQLHSITNASEEDFEFNSILSHSWVDGILVFNVELTSGKTLDIPFPLLKKDRPIETARYINIHVLEESRHGIHTTWAKNILKQANRSIRRMSHHYNVDRFIRIKKYKEISTRRISRNKQMEKHKNRIKFGIRVPNSVREALIFDRENKNTLWGDAIQKEMAALDKAQVFQYHPGHFKISKGFQYAPLRIIFDIKQEDLRHKARLVAGGHVVNSSMYESYSSVVQTMTVRLLQTIALKQKLKIVTGDIGNAFVQALTNEKIWSKAGPEFGPRQGCKIIFKKALYGLATSARQWNLKLGDSLKRMGFKTSRADADLWLKESECGTTYDYIATHVDDVICVGKDPQKYIETLKEQFPIRNIELTPAYYLGNTLERKNNNSMKVSLKKYINEVLARYERKHGTLRKENVPHSPNDHPETDDSPYLDADGITQFQSIMGICQWISIAGRMDITFAVASMSRFSSSPKENHLKRAIKILGYLKKYPSKGYTVDPRAPILNYPYEKLEPDFGNQYADFVEDMDDKLPSPKMEELPITIFVDSNHGHDLVTGKSISGILAFVGRTPIVWHSKRQGSVQSSTFGAEFIALKKGVEEAITIRYYLRSMGVKVSEPTVIYGDNLSAIKNTIEPGSPLKKKYLALSYHFCREHFSAGIVDIRKIDSKFNFADPFTKGLQSNEFHTHFNGFMAN